MTKEIVNCRIAAVTAAYNKLPSVPNLVTIGWDYNEALKFSLETSKIATKIQNAIFAVIFDDFDTASFIINDACTKTFNLLNDIIRH